MSDPIPEVELATYVVTCETIDCENEGIALTVLADADDPNVVCGPCAQQITNVIPTEGG